MNELLSFDTCKIANAIEVLKLRLRNEGFTQPGLRCVTGGFPAIIGYAVTSKVRCANPPMRGATSRDLTDWWAKLRERPVPRVAVIQDIDDQPGQGAVLSQMHAEVLRSLQCCGVVTNGSVRNIPSLAAMSFPAFACHVTMSHAYVHLVDFGVPVEILGLDVSPGDLIHADVHGVLSIPAQHVDDILRVAREREQRLTKIVDLCRGTGVSFDRLKAEIHELENLQ
ncbi:RraA family protein [uncultured Paludibaculum sp.]|uniref:RraA family protein n=1 Tax=uncultured Paludibaculum sp. TaxID=1765020 RepID=UPI002AAAA948|nr:RraA family protein [uncultured Paludibaculum sp.]